MCTAIVLRDKNLYFGRNFDLEYGLDESVVITPRNFVFHEDRNDRPVSCIKSRPAMIGMAHTEDGCPLYYEATNEQGLSIAALNFPGYAHYGSDVTGKTNIAPWELIPWVLGQCGSASEACKLLSNTNIVDIPFSKSLPNTPLHWMIAGRDGAFAAEPMKDGLRITDDPAGILTNSPPLEYHLSNLCCHMQASPREPENRFSQALPLKPFSRGMGAMGLPGDLSSPSRFVHGAFVLMNSVCGDSEEQRVSQFFHILAAVAQQRGCVRPTQGGYEITRYSSCCNADTGTYYYTTYDNSRISAVRMDKADLDGSVPQIFPLRQEPDILRIN